MSSKAYEDLKKNDCSDDPSRTKLDMDAGQWLAARILIWLVFAAYMIHFCIWVVVPAYNADSVMRERMRDNFGWIINACVALALVVIQGLLASSSDNYILVE